MAKKNKKSVDDAQSTANNLQSYNEDNSEVEFETMEDAADVIENAKTSTDDSNPNDDEEFDFDSLKIPSVDEIDTDNFDDDDVQLLSIGEKYAMPKGDIYISETIKNDVIYFTHHHRLYDNDKTDSAGRPILAVKEGPNPTITSKSKNQLYKFATDWYFEYMEGSGYTVDPNVLESTLLFITQKFFQTYNEQDAVVNKEIPKLKLPDTLSTSQIADIMAKLYPIVRINCCEQSTDVDYDLLGLYIDNPNAKAYGTYVTDEDVFRKLARKFSYNMTEKDFKEINLALRDKVKRKIRTDDKNLIAVNNGIFDYETKQLLPFNENYIFLAKSQVNYNENATNIVIHNNDDGTDWDVESWIAEITDDPEIEQVIWEILGAIIRPNVHWNKSAWFYSETGNNGKGTLCELMRQLCGDTSYASIPLSDFGKDFVLEPLTRATAIIVDENDVGTFIDKAGNLKSVITNDVIQINRKYKVPIAYQFKGFMVQCLNEYPKIRDKSDSFYRRQLFIPFTKCFTGKERKYIKYDYLRRKEVLEYVLYKILNSNYYSLSEPKACKRTLDEYKEYNDPVRQFFDEMHDEFVWDFLPFKFIYDLYKAWFKLNIPSGTCIGRNAFIHDLQNVIRNDDTWWCEDQRKQYRVLANYHMDRPEPLILKYNLTNWMAPYYAGKDPDQICRPKWNDKYRGILRLGNGNDNDDNTDNEEEKENSEN